MIRILIVDDHPICREGIKLKLDDPEIEIIKEASCAREAMKYIQDVLPEVVLLDVHLPDISGLTVLQEIKRRHPKIKVIIITGTHHIPLLLRLLKQGADGVMLKSSVFSYVEMVKAVHTGKIYIQPDISIKFISHTGCEHLLDCLTNRDYEILNLLFKGKTNQIIAEQLNISSRHVSNVKCNILKKAGVRNLTEIKKKLWDCYNSSIT